MRSIKYLLPFFLITTGLVSGQNKINLVSSSDVHLYIETIDSVIINNPDRRQDLKIYTSSFASNYTNSASIINDFEIGYKSSIEVNLPIKSNYVYVSFGLQTPPGHVKFNSFDNTYLMQKGDSISCTLSQKYYFFSGKGAEKLNCQSEIHNLKYTSNRQELKFLNSKDFKNYFKISNKRRDSLFNLQLNVVNKYAYILGKKMTGIMLANSYGYRFYQMLRSYYSMAKSSPNSFLEMASNTSYKETIKAIDLSLNDKLNDEILVASPIYSNFLIEKIIVDNLIDTNINKVNIQSKIQELVFNRIINSYNGLLREKLLTLFFYRFINSDLNYLQQALDVVRDNDFRACLLAIKTTKSEGAIFFPFELLDTKGKMVKLSDFDEKVVILDFWYTGCTNCAILYEGMKPLVEKYKQNPKVKFVSISIDKDKNNWIKSVGLNRYTDSSHINLYTNGLGYKHPVIEVNSIKGYPTIFILKRGKVFSTSPPKPGPPSIDKFASKTIAAFTALIDDALSNNDLRNSNIQ